ncbi:MAG: hypothetical protein R8K49_04185 [Mariprofundaceae bacterium]
MKDCKLSIYQFVLSMFVVLVMPSAAGAKDSLESVLSAASDQQLLVLNYREVKHFMLLQEPVQASGRIFLQGENFVLEQLQAKRLLLTIDKQRLRFYMPDKHARYSKMMGSPMMQQALKLFKPLFSGDVKAIEQAFDTTFSSTKQRWSLSLKPKQGKAANFSNMRVEGKATQAADYVWVEMMGGDSSEWFFSVLASSDSDETVMQALLEEAKR